MAGIAGEQIAALGGQPPIGGSPKAKADGGDSARGCLVNFIGYGSGLSSAEPLPNDFLAADDTVTRSTTLPKTCVPTYTAIAGNTTHQTLTWVET